MPFSMASCFVTTRVRFPGLVALRRISHFDEKRAPQRAVRVRRFRGFSAPVKRDKVVEISFPYLIPG